MTTPPNAFNGSASSSGTDSNAMLPEGATCLPGHEWHEDSRDNLDALAYIDNLRVNLEVLEHYLRTLSAALRNDTVHAAEPLQEQLTTRVLVCDDLAARVQELGEGLDEIEDAIADPEEAEPA